jgi:hypothetical protein
LDCCAVVPGSIPDLAPTWRSPALSGTCDEETQRDFNEWRWMYVKKYECMLKMEKSIKILYIKFFIINVFLKKRLWSILF